MPMKPWKELYPFAPNWITTREGHRLHYVDTGSGFPVVMVHGNPTWSFMYRDLIRQLESHGHRCIALDNLGCGLSEKPQNWEYCLKNHVANLTQLIETDLKLEKFDLVVHDWGGAIGMGYAIAHPERIRKIILMNTAAYTMPECPRRIALARMPYLGAFLVRGLNLFVRAALRMAPAKKMPRAVQEGFAAPYDNWDNRVAVQRFVQDIPMKPSHKTWNVLKNIENNLHLLKDKQIMLCWGEKDFCFGMEYFNKWKTIFPDALGISYPDCAHYLLEDNPDQIVPMILRFLK